VTVDELDGGRGPGAARKRDGVRARKPEG
jgi:hypothetical protein